MMEAATLWLERHVQAIDALNVFPVPDGDTGTNMLLTMRFSLEEGHRSQATGAGEMAKAIGRGALMGARGNSGVILSQILRGLARGMEGLESCNAADLVRGLGLASDLAYKSLSKPVEGTMLTVMRQVAKAVETCSDTDMTNMMERATGAAKEAVEETPSQLPILKEAGVVDAGGQGLFILLEGSWRFLQGERLSLLTPSGGERRTEEPVRQGELQQVYGYCTEFLIRPNSRGLPELDLAEMRAKLDSLGDSVILVADEAVVKVHLHTFDPGAALTYSSSLGLLHRIKIDNIDDQHQEYVKVKQAPLKAPAVATVAVVNGSGLERVLRSLGAGGIVQGGETMNPSVQEIQRVVEEAPQEQVVVLPNNPNVIASAHLVQSMSKKSVCVVPAESIPQGIAALLALNPEEDLEANLKAMERARLLVTTMEICHATRTAELYGIRIRQGQPMGLVNGQLAASGSSEQEVLYQLLDEAGMQEGALITLYYGSDVTPQEAKKTSEGVRQRFPQQEVELAEGGQPHYSYIVSVE